jgi:hypothetical protein
MQKIDLNDIRVLLNGFIRKDSREGIFYNTLNTTGQLSSSASNGIPPLTVLSTTTVTNLNADTVDGYHAAELLAGAGVSDHGLLTGLTDDDHSSYHTDGRALIWLATRSTSDLPEGTNQYFTNERVDNRIADLIIAGSGVSINYNDTSNTMTINTFLGGTMDHGSLEELNDDDHTQYLLANGTRATSVLTVTTSGMFSGDLRADDIFSSTLSLTPQALDPTNPVEGTIYYNSADKQFYGWIGTEWVILG